ncbi:B-cell linker protein [Kryptolebias marmoratus]|uniref:B-cell linker protein n=1 Tax=Kryptolebias marmoratus TaxID=37003 RepID=UPI0018ACC782|nr:B-cell linker protein [Kryptolebias marmoratus]
MDLRQMEYCIQYCASCRWVINSAFWYQPLHFQDYQLCSHFFRTGGLVALTVMLLVDFDSFSGDFLQNHFTDGNQNLGRKCVQLQHESQLLTRPLEGCYIWSHVSAVCLEEGRLTAGEPASPPQSFFGKLKNLNSGPPAPPRRTDNNAGFEWPQDEFDDEEGDMYEVPPCERPQVKVPPKHEHENIYLERTSSPAVPQRQAAPPPPRPSRASKPQPVENLSDNTKKPPEVDRTEKPGRKMMPPPAARPALAPAPVPVSDDDDVYLDPNEEQEDDDLYLEPEAACSPSPREPTRPLPSPKTGPPPPKPMMKPPVPRAHTHSAFSSMNEMKSTLSDEDRRASYPTKLTPVTPGVKPPLPVNRKEPKPTHPVHLMADTKSVGGFRKTKQSGNEDKEWFAGDCNRKHAEDLLQRVRKDGAFLIRYSSNHSTTQPYTLAMLYQQKVYNIPIRFAEETQSYALGKEGKTNEKVFSSLDEMITYHKKNQILLIDSKSQAKHTANLTQAVRP